MSNAPDLCPEGCYWQCEHRDAEPRPWSVRQLEGVTVNGQLVRRLYSLPSESLAPSANRGKGITAWLKAHPEQA